MIKIKKNKGFSLVGVMVAAGILGLVSVGVMQLMKNINQGQIFAKSSADEIELRTEIEMLLDDERYCRISLAGKQVDGLAALDAAGNSITQTKFNKVDIDGDADTSALNIALFLSNPDGDARTLKKFNGSDNPGSDDKSKYGKLIITSMKLLMNNPPLSVNYPTSVLNHSDTGELHVTIQKKISATSTRTISLRAFPIKVSMSTNDPLNPNETTILSCKRALDLSQVSNLCEQMGGHYSSTSGRCRYFYTLCLHCEIEPGNDPRPRRVCSTQNKWSEFTGDLNSENNSPDSDNNRCEIRLSSPADVVLDYKVCLKCDPDGGSSSGTEVCTTATGVWSSFTGDNSNNSYPNTDNNSCKIKLERAGGSTLPVAHAACIQCNPDGGDTIGAEVCTTTPGVYSASTGDLSNNDFPDKDTNSCRILFKEI